MHGCAISARQKFDRKAMSRIDYEKAISAALGGIASGDIH
jgi:hypothetical protein